MPADLEQELNELGARLLAEAPAVTSDEVIRFTSERRSLVMPIDPLIRDVPVLADITDIATARRPSRRSVLIASVAAASMLVVGLGMATGLSDDDDPTAVGTAPATNVAPTSPTPTTTTVGNLTPTSTAPAVGATISWPPRVLLDDSWEIIDANERSINDGYAIFQRDGVSVLVGWYRGENVGTPDRALEGATESGTAALLGQPVLVYTPAPAYRVGDIKALIASGELQSERLEEDFGLDSTDDNQLIGGELLEAELSQVIADGLIEGVATEGPFATLVQNAAALSVQVMPGETNPALTPEELAALAPTLRQVEPSEWEAALPDEVVTPAERPAVIDELLTGVRLPENFNPSFGDDVGGQQLVQTRIAIADEIVKAIACTWLTNYFTATDEGDAEAAQEATDAISSMPDWAVSQELAAAMADPAPGIIPVPNSSMLEFSVGEDGAIMYNGDVATNELVVTMCYVDAEG